MKSWILLAAAAWALPACASFRGGAPEAGAAEAGTGAAEPEEEGIGMAVVSYIPNRILDLFDILKIGVNVGPGVGFHAEATDPAQALLISRESVGVGFQTLRYMPFSGGVESASGTGTLPPDTWEGLGWRHSPTDLRLEIHPEFVGAHAAVDPVEIADFLLGLFLIDIRRDDR